MKRVIIVRHAKAVPYGYENDFDRELTDRGEKDAGNIGRELKRKGISPDMMISSPAARALKTAQIFAENLDFDISRIQEKMDIYDGLTTAEFLSILYNLPETVRTVFFFGHNPGFHYFVSNLLKNFTGDMPTCSTIVIRFEVDSWQKVEARKGELDFQLVPAQFKI
ncbi:MAG: histidine phosphatase family protein [Draconibacterium sp.]